MLNSSHLLICSLTFTNSFIQAYCIMFELRSCVVTWLSSWHIRITSIAFFRRTLGTRLGSKNKPYWKYIFRVTWLTNTANADPKFVRKRVWGRKEGIEAKKKKSKVLHVYSDKHYSYDYLRVLFLACDGKRRGDPNVLNSAWRVGKLRIFISYGTCF